MTRRRWSQALAAFALLLALTAIALWWYRVVQARQHASTVEAAQQALAEERDRQRSAVALEREQVVRELDRLLEQSEVERALTLAARYHLAEDAQIQQRYRRAVTLLSDQQLVARLRRLLSQHCNADQARVSPATRLQERLQLVNGVDSAAWQVTPLVPASVIDAIAARLQAPGATEHLHEDAVERVSTMTAAALASGELARLQPVVRRKLLGREPDAQYLLCAWRVAGTVPTAIPQRFTVVLWLAPDATERQLLADILSSEHDGSTRR